MLNVICSQPRTGTHMVRTALNTHPSLGFASEVFNGLVNGPELAKQSTKALMTAYAAGFCCHCYDEDETVGTWPDWYKATEMWDAIRTGTVQDVKAIVLWRECKIAQAVSYIKAEMSGKFHTMKMANEPDNVDSPITVPPWLLRHLMERFEEATAFQIEVMDGANVERVRISYEQLVVSPDHHFHKIQKLLGVQPRPIVPTTKKLSKQTLPQQVSNWSNLVRSFRGTKWGHYFEKY